MVKRGCCTSGTPRPLVTTGVGGQRARAGAQPRPRPADSAFLLRAGNKALSPSFHLTSYVTQGIVRPTNEKSGLINIHTECTQVLVRFFFPVRVPVTEHHLIARNPDILPQHTPTPSYLEHTRGIGSKILDIRNLPSPPFVWTYALRKTAHAGFRPADVFARDGLTRAYTRPSL